MIYGNTVGGSGGGLGKTIIIRDSVGNELVGVVTDKRVIFDATANDIRAGKVAATQNGVTTGKKEIPAYHTTEGSKVVTNGSKLILPILDYGFTKLQAIVCAFNTSLSDSVAANKVVINGSVYPVQSTTAEATVSVDDTNKYIDLGLTNDSGSPVVVKYFIYKEIY